jgi:ectoine hydroxylase-related dioxygenase (phytanoyl-CoA dioxygenase family)
MNILNQPYPINAEQLDFYRENQFIKLKQVLDAETIDRFNEVISEQVSLISTEKRKLEDRDTYGKAFLQLFNLWQINDSIKNLVFSKRLAGIAATLMEVEGVRLYHDQALFKEAGGGITPWHADQYYWPLATDRTITAWIPLQETPLDMGPLEFSAGSHRILEGRELAISDESEQKIGSQLRINNFPIVAEAFDIGEVSFHSGWIFHRAGANTGQQMRKVMTIIYMDKNMRLKAPENSGQQADWETWCPGAGIGEIIDTPLNPILI